MRLPPSHIQRASELVARAFHNDSLIVHLFPDEFQRAGLLPVYRFIVDYGYLYGEVHTTSADVEGVAIWLPPHQTSISTWKSLRAGAWLLPLKLNPLLLFRFLPAERLSAKAHKRYATIPHWYLFLLCVDPKHQGKGYGSALLQMMLARIDRQRLPCYLETTEQRNVPFYERYGFRVVGADRIPGTPSMLWAMLREGTA